MFIPLDDLKTQPAHEMREGTFFVPVTGHQREAGLFVVISGGREVAGKLAVALWGEQAFRAYRLPQAQLHGFAVPMRAPLSIELPEPAKTIGQRYDHGVLAIDEVGAYVGINWTFGPHGDNFSWLSLSDWTLQESPARHPHCGWFDRYRLVSQPPSEPSLVLAEGRPTEPAS